MERPEQDAGPSTRAAIAAGSAVPGRRAGSLPGPASSLTASLPLDPGSKATAPAPARAPSFQPNLEPLRSTLTLEFSACPTYQDALCVCVSWTSLVSSLGITSR